MCRCVHCVRVTFRIVFVADSMSLRHKPDQIGGIDVARQDTGGHRTRACRHKVARGCLGAPNPNPVREERRGGAGKGYDRTFWMYLMPNEMVTRIFDSRYTVAAGGVLVLHQFFLRLHPDFVAGAAVNGL